MKVAILGAGSWGTALGIQLARNGHAVTLWDRDAERAARVDATRENARYLPGIPLPDGLRATGELARTLSGAGLVVIAVPSQAVRALMSEVGPLLETDALVCCASKGIEVESLQTMDQVLHEVLPASLHAGIVALGGPSFAKEVALGLPTAVVVAGGNHDAAQRTAEAFHASTPAMTSSASRWARR